MSRAYFILLARGMMLTGDVVVGENQNHHLSSIGYEVNYKVYLRTYLYTLCKNRSFFKLCFSLWLDKQYSLELTA